VESPFVLPRIKSKQMLPGKRGLVSCVIISSVVVVDVGSGLTFEGGAAGPCPLANAELASFMFD